MHNDSIDTLLLRHYGHAAATPQGLEHRLQAALKQDVAEMQQQQRATEHLRTRAVSRRRAVALVALGTAGLGLLNVTLEGLQMLETAMTGQEASQTAFP